MDKHKIPEGLYKCEKCDEYKGKVKVDPNNMLSVDELGKALTVSCLCGGVLCPQCKKNKIHRPISNSYDEKSNTIVHWPYFTGMAGCEKCRKER